ncbi:hypothetical protein GCM10011344_40700 [Dokdonia pacifica]|uniref:Alpha-ketoglutarate decarboxylase n=1 Tax=Dokdonia pacifica TaxID=1627892 RepID=A0A239A9N4_9FLAO|nr:hypothetical protein [Dokdonia pacifica]GGG35680.1 hypothetical protein GCM10011344_40700 [Dokdonia pacifica]SNR92219.1 hypothetical protein SAMN06265376_104255 [Dokdonia pacifica]
MKYKSYVSLCILFVLFLGIQSKTIAQEDPAPKPQSEFWKKVRFGGGLGLAFGSNNTQITVAPSAIYQYNPYIAFGPGLNFNYQKFRDFSSTLYGVSGIFLANPIPEVQLSAEVEQLFGTQRIESIGGDITNDINNTALFLGAGYRIQGVTIGARYNVLFDNDDGIYAEAWQPFVRVYF